MPVMVMVMVDIRMWPGLRSLWLGPIMIRIFFQSKMNWREGREGRHWEKLTSQLSGWEESETGGAPPDIHDISDDRERERELLPSWRLTTVFSAPLPETGHRHRCQHPHPPLGAAPPHGEGEREGEKYHSLAQPAPIIKPRYCTAEIFKAIMARRFQTVEEEGGMEGGWSGWDVSWVDMIN